jgi:hypothetical protein
MAAKPKPNTVRTLHAAKRVAAKTTGSEKPAGGARKAASNKRSVSPSTTEKTALDVLHLFVKTYANL